MHRAYSVTIATLMCFMIGHLNMLLATDGVNLSIDVSSLTCRTGKEYESVTDFGLNLQGLFCHQYAEV